MRETRGAGKGLAESDNDLSEGTERGTPAGGGDGGLLSPGEFGGEVPEESDISKIQANSCEMLELIMTLRH